MRRDEGHYGVLTYSMLTARRREILRVNHGELRPVDDQEILGAAAPGVGREVEAAGNHRCLIAPFWLGLILSRMTVTSTPRRCAAMIAAIMRGSVKLDVCTSSSRSAFSISATSTAAQSPPIVDLLPVVKHTVASPAV